MKTDDPEKQLAAALGRVASGLYVLTVKHGEVARRQLGLGEIDEVRPAPAWLREHARWLVHQQKALALPHDA